MRRSEAGASVAAAIVASVRRVAEPGSLGDKAVLIEYLADRIELLPELAQLHLSEWGHLRPGQSLESRISNLESCCKTGTIPLVIVATNDSELIGSAMLVTHDMSTRQDLSPWLAGVYVKKQFRRAGVATKLVARIEQEATALKVPRLHLYTDKKSQFYEKQGWQLFETCGYKNLDVTIMTKELVG